MIFFDGIPAAIYYTFGAVLGLWNYYSGLDSETEILPAVFMAGSPASGWDGRILICPALLRICKKQALET